MVVLKGILKQGLYVLQGKAISGDATISALDKNETKIWNRRLGHIGMKGLQELCKQGVMDSKRIGVLDFCEICALGKPHRVQFASSTHKSNDILEYVYSNLWGFPQVPHSLSNAQYFISFVNDFSRKLWVYFLKYKSEVFKKFKEWKTLVEHQTGKIVKNLRTDNGLKYCNHEFTNFCKQNGIARYKTCSETLSKMELLRK